MPFSLAPLPPPRRRLHPRTPCQIKSSTFLVSNGIEAVTVASSVSHSFVAPKSAFPLAQRLGAPVVVTLTDGFGFGVAGRADRVALQAVVDDSARHTGADNLT